ncbi:helix-turn-helix transcriptional regulator [Actinomadura sp. 3N407]|uniref:helix-turn-helix transcriptional regulator n=1 Tax=Actinomadura sp. 3N407 TaxID=3457423 RepID=UPI003FCEAF2C
MPPKVVGAPGDAGPLPTGGVPAELTTFIGRLEELEEVERLIAARRLVTLTGIGGCGKTRLAARLADRLGNGLPGGVWWADLTSVGEGEQVARAVASVMGVFVDPDTEPLHLLAGLLRERHLLLCLDNCEHLLAACADLVNVLLRACPGMSILATSREPLGVPGEAVRRVPSLQDEESLSLFADRAALVAPGFPVDDHEADVRAICRRVDGIPLAIELAAAWVRMLSPSQIRSGLETSMHLLAGGPRGALPRHRTLSGSMAWSHALLEEDDRVVFRRLAVFAGTFSLDAVQAVCVNDGSGPPQDMLTVLTRLVDKSLVVVREGETDVRYRLLDTVRQYADERLREAGELPSTRDRHLDYYLALAERGERELDRDQDTWRRVLSSHHDNVAAALNRGLGSGLRDERVRRLAAAMARFWFVRGWVHEGLRYLRRAIALDSEDRSAVQGRLWCGVAMLGMVSGRLDQAAEAAERALAISGEAGDDRTSARCLVMAAYRPFFFDFQRCHSLAIEGHEIGRRIGDPFSRDWGLVVAAYSLSARDRHDEAVEVTCPAFEESRRRGDRFCASFARTIDLFAAMYCGDVRGAVSFGDESLAIVEPLGDYFAVGTNLSQAALARGMAGDIPGGLRLLVPVIRMVDQAPDAHIVGYMVTIGLLHLWAGDLDDAWRWLDRGTRSLTPEGVDWMAARCMAGLAGVLRRLGRPEEAERYAARAVALGRGLGSSMVLADGLTEQAFLVAGSDPGRALELHHEALTVRRTAGIRTFYADSLDALAGNAAATGRHALAVRLYAASTAGREQMGYPRRPVDDPDVISVLDALRSALDEGFQATWDEGFALSLDDAVDLATRGRGTRERPTIGWESLTPTELKVASLVVEGLTNPEIGDRLFISRATVKTHLAHIYRKLDIGNRTELARVASTRMGGGST